jgi:nitroimidazol reductase NimA-like FMN-containing flavoprotein (pyridoxamine 5'-phosphate oxidase superfamily)
VPTTDPDRDHRQLDAAECLRLMAAAGIGRLAYTQSALPAVRPVSFCVRGEEVLIPAPAAGDLVDAVSGTVVAFQTDVIDPVQRTGWSVTAVGPSRVLEGAAATPGAELPAGFCLIAVRLTLLQGWCTSARG